MLSLSAGENFSQETGENEAKNGLFLQLRKLGIYAKTAHFLLEHYPEERIRKCLELYPLAVKAGRADGPGWLVKAVSDPNWDLELEAVDLQERAEAADQQVQEQTTGVDKPGGGLPKSVQADLRNIGWSGSTAELVEQYRGNRKRFKAWLEWALDQPREYAAARFLTGLRSGLMPPVEKSQSNNPRRYLEGPYAEYIIH